MATIKYKGIELKTITDPQIFDPPKKMVVCNTQFTKIEERTVSAIVKDAKGDTWAITHPCFIGDILEYWAYCAEIPEDLKPRRATNREISKWLAQGNGEVTEGREVERSGPYCKTSLYYDSAKSNEICSEVVKIRKWDDTDWHEPTVDYMDIEEKEGE